MPRLHRRLARASLAAVASVVLAGAIAFGPPWGNQPAPAGVLGDVQDLVEADTAAGSEAKLGTVAAPGRNPVDGDALLRFLKDPKPIQVIPPDPATLTGYRWPVTSVRITSPFGPARTASRIVNGRPFHDGLDVATFCGDRLYAAHAGVVLAAGRKYDDHVGWIGDLAPYYERLNAKNLWSTLPIVVVIDDGNGYRSMYAHLSKVAVSVGQAIEAGTFIGWEGRTGRASGCHLHYGLFSPAEPGTMAIDPEVVRRMLVPALEIARIDPLRVLPARP